MVVGGANGSDSQSADGWLAWRLISPGSETAVSVQSRLTCDDGGFLWEAGSQEQMSPHEV